MAKATRQITVYISFDDLQAASGYPVRNFDRMEYWCDDDGKRIGIKVPLTVPEEPKAK